MTKQEAENLLARNPKVKTALTVVDISKTGMDISKLDYLYLPGKVSFAADAPVNWIEVLRSIASQG